MNYIQELSPPFISIEKESYYDSLKSKLDLFNKFIMECEFSKILSAEDCSSIKSISNKILHAINEYLSGKSGSAYKTISEQLETEYSNWENIAYSLSEKNSLIRIRRSTENLHKRKDLFHIPFHLRQMVGKQRYSIEGLPCLYLAATSYTAWLELYKPNFNEMWVSAFRATERISILDLSYTIGKLLNDFKNSIITARQTIDKLKLFPFVLATSYRIKYPHEPFHEEYIISGKILQWIASNTEFKGIRYLSTKLESYDSSEFLWCASNFVIPPVGHTPEETYNKFLTTRFKLTEPQNCAVLISYSNAGEVTAFKTSGKFEEYSQEPLIINSALKSNIDDLIFANYIDTDFFNVDGYLSTLFKIDYI